MRAGGQRPLVPPVRVPHAAGRLAGRGRPGPSPPERVASNTQASAPHAANWPPNAERLRQPETQPDGTLYTVF